MNLYINIYGTHTPVNSMLSPIRFVAHGLGRDTDTVKHAYLDNRGTCIGLLNIGSTKYVSKGTSALERWDIHIFFFLS